MTKEEASPVKIPRLRSANEFSPGVINLMKVLQLAHDNKGDKQAFVESLRSYFFYDHAKSHSADPTRRLNEQKKLANNVVIGLSNYELYSNETFELTEVGSKLLALSEPDVYLEFAKHIIYQLDGISLIDVVRLMHERKEEINKKSLAEELSQHGFTTFQGKEIPLNTTDHLRMIQWLRLSGLFPGKTGYEIDNDVYEDIVGAPSGVTAEIRSLTPPQRAFLKTLYGLAVAGKNQSFFVKDVLKVSTTQHGKIYSPIADQLAVKVLKPLLTNGWIKISGQGAGRGGKSGKIEALDKLLTLEQSLFDLCGQEAIPADLKGELNKSVDDIYKDLESKDTYVKGIALELLTYRIASAIGLTVSDFRKRGVTTGGAEVDLVCDGVHLHYSRWLVQCKNTKSVSVSDLAKEIGMAMLLKANVILLVTTGKFKSSVKIHANNLASSTHLQAVLIDGEVLDNFKKKELGFILQYLTKNAQETMKLKRGQVAGVDE